MPPPSTPRLRKPAASAPPVDGAIAAKANPLRQLRASDLRGVARLAAQATTGISRVAEGCTSRCWARWGCRAVPSRVVRGG